MKSPDTLTRFVAAVELALVLSDRRNRQVMARAKRPAQHAGNGREVQS